MVRTQLLSPSGSSRDSLSPARLAPARALAQLLGEQDPDLTDQMSQPLQEQPVRGVAAGRHGPSLVLLTIRGLDPEAGAVQVASRPPGRARTLAHCGPDPAKV